MKLTENALKVLEKRYFRKNENGVLIEDWDKMLTRVASNIASGDEEKTNRFYQLMDAGYFLPNSPTLMNAGGDLQQLSACFVLPIEDSMESIFETVKNAALIHKSGGGTGFSFSHLREANARVRSTNGVSSGPLSFLKVFNAATDAVKQGGTRRGANMAILNVDHPQILDFITCKENPAELTNFNISVGITEDFMQAVANDDEYNLISPHTGVIYKKLKARDVFALIVKMAHKNGEPGIVFLDRLNNANPTPALGKIESTNPCGEQPLLPYEACNLGSINLALLIKDGDVDWDKLKEVVRESVDFLDAVIDVSKFPLPQIEKISQANRKIGLGVMGWADLLFQLKIPCASEEAVALAAKLMEFIDFYAKERSSELAQEKGAFPNFQESIYATGYLKREKINQPWDSLKEKIKKEGIRNATLTTIAPTGTISMIADTSSGIEPQFSLAYVKNVMDGEKLIYVNKYLQKALEEKGIYNNKLLEEILTRGSLAGIEGIPDDLKKVFQTAHDISPEWHIRMQAAFQKYTDNAVSKTINFPNSATVEDIQSAYELAYHLGCKGVTVYRDGSRESQVLYLGTQTTSPEKTDKKVAPRTRPEITKGITQRLETGCGHMYVTINTDAQGACEVFIQMGKVGGCASAQLEAIARLVSLALRSQIKIESITRQLKGIRCQSPMWNKGKMITSCGDAVGQALEQFVTLYTKGQIQAGELSLENENPGSHQSVGNGFALCPDCGNTIEHTEGCLKCPACGWSKC
ncbi:MAG TPA: vitamin B12-dependent ribonucleotide reductase [Candidatus Cloacimonas acidaminovorans]|nr:vitamin B12-dependent ribonucleotide reductase [Candidatus Cloacimonas acidaminovorans]HOT38756.1 vitamin B12-dependent ribonucleotide reductase [Candidatus Cloacimonas acidaminovorans]HRU82747.1 vitamin B12-dependent ribonucleotide reductase [Candidatus Cloacimonas sp.]